MQGGVPDETHEGTVSKKCSVQTNSHIKRGVFVCTLHLCALCLPLSAQGVV